MNTTQIILSFIGIVSAAFQAFGLFILKNMREDQQDTNARLNQFITSHIKHLENHAEGKYNIGAK